MANSSFGVSWDKFLRPRKNYAKGSPNHSLGKSLWPRKRFCTEFPKCSLDLSPSLLWSSGCMDSSPKFPPSFVWSSGAVPWGRSLSSLHLSPSLPLSSGTLPWGSPLAPKKVLWKASQLFFAFVSQSSLASWFYGATEHFFIFTPSDLWRLSLTFLCICLRVFSGLLDWQLPENQHHAEMPLGYIFSKVSKIVSGKQILAFAPIASSMFW